MRFRSRDEAWQTNIWQRYFHVHMRGQKMIIAGVEPQRYINLARVNRHRHDYLARSW